MEVGIISSTLKALALAAGVARPYALGAPGFRARCDSRHLLRPRRERQPFAPSARFPGAHSVSGVSRHVSSSLSWPQPPLALICSPLPSRVSGPGRSGTRDILGMCLEDVHDTSEFRTHGSPRELSPASDHAQSATLPAVASRVECAGDRRTSGRFTGSGLVSLACWRHVRGRDGAASRSAPSRPRSELGRLCPRLVEAIQAWSRPPQLWPKPR